MDKDTVINRILFDLNEVNFVHLEYDSIALDELNIEIDYMLFCLRKAHELKLTKISDNENYTYIPLTDKGAEIKKNGGWLAYLERERIHLANLDKQKKNSTKEPKNRFWLILDKVLILCGIVTFIILVAENIYEDTPYIGMDWWKKLFGF